MGAFEDDMDYGIKLERQEKLTLEFHEEFLRARKKFLPMASAHEGIAVIEEEYLELRGIVYQKQSERDYAKMRKEVIQLGAMALAFLIEIVETENRR